jgi:hypothetical protein
MATRQVTSLAGTPAQVAAQLRVVRAEDMAQDTERAITQRRAGWTFGGGCAGAIATFFLFALLGPFAPVVLAGALGLLVVGIVNMVRASRMSEMDLDNERLAFANELIETLAPDFSDKKALALTLRHGDSVRFGIPAATRTEGGWLTGRVNFSEHEDTWFSLGGRLQDGSLFKLAVTQVVKRKSKPKRKYTKVTDRCRDEVTLVMRVPQAAYPHLDRLQASLQPQRLAQHAGMALTVLQAQGASIRAKAVTTGYCTKQVLRYSRPESGVEHRMSAQKVIGLLAFLYSGLSHCRREPPPAAADAATSAAPSNAAPPPSA